VIDPKVDEMALREYYWKDEKRLRKIFSLSLHDLNDRGRLTKKFTRGQIDSYIDKVMRHIESRAPLRQMPGLVKFGPHYGVGNVLERRTGVRSGGSDADADTETDTESGTNADVGGAEVGPIATAVTLVEITIAVTFLGFPLQEIEDPVKYYTNEIAKSPFVSSSTVVAMSTIANLLSFVSDLSLFVQNIEKEN
jgi:hypothetical protein